MDATTFDGKSRDLDAATTRRGMLRLLGGAAAIGAILVAGNDSLARGKGHTKGKSREQVSAQRNGKRITICYRGQIKRVRKSKLQNFPGAARGACAMLPPGAEPLPEPPKSEACTRWILSGGPNQTDRILADDDLLIYNQSRNGAAILLDVDRKATWNEPAVFNAEPGERIAIVGYDNGGCRAISPIWLHCQATGASRQIYSGFDGGQCDYMAGTFVGLEFTV